MLVLKTKKNPSESGIEEQDVDEKIQCVCVALWMGKKQKERGLGDNRNRDLEMFATKVAISHSTTELPVLT